MLAKEEKDRPSVTEILNNPKVREWAGEFAPEMIKSYSYPSIEPFDGKFEE